MPHIHDKPGQHDLVVGAFIFYRTKQGYQVLLHRHKISKKYSHPGGHVELDEDPWQAPIKEIREETGYDESQLTLLQPNNRVKELLLSEAKVIPQPLFINTHKAHGTKDHIHIDMEYVLTAESKSSIHKVAESESQDIKFFSLKEVDELVSENDCIGFVHDTVSYIVLNILDSWEQIPASTLSE